MIKKSIKNYLFKNAKKYSVLYVEDNDTVRNQMQSVLGALFRDLYIAEDGQIGLELYKQCNADIVITDITMPNMNGLEMIEQIQKINPDTSFIIVTAYSQKENLLKALELGISKYLVKPMQEDKFFDMLYKSIYDLEFVNQHEKMQEESELLKLTMELSPIFTSIIEDKKIKYINKSFLEFMGFNSFKEFTSSEIQLCDLIKDEKSKCIFTNSNDYIKKALNYKDNSKKVYLKNRENQYVAFQLTNKYYPNINTLISVFTDINEIDEKNRELVKLTEIDTLTNLYNKYKFNKEFETIFTQFKNQELKSASLIIIGIDDLKEINQRYGHKVGDKVVRSVAHFIKGELRSGEFLARYAGVEFVIIAKNSTLKEAFALSNLLSDSLMKHHNSKLSCSFGITEFKSTDEMSTILTRVDDSLLKAQKSGKNQVIASI